MEPIQPNRSPGAAGPNGNGKGHAAHHEDEIDLNVHAPSPVWVVLAGIGGIALLAALLASGLIPRQRQETQLNRDAAEAANAPVMVRLTKPRRATTQVSVPLPGTLRPWQEVSIYARTTGYLKKYHVDISETVKKGQLMADVETPEVDQQLNQAVANLEVNKAAVNTATTNLALAEATYKRYQEAAKTHSVSAQDLDEKKSARDAAEAALASAKANVLAGKATVDRFRELQSFEKVTAPFGGVVTGRAYDNGSLIIADPTNIDIKPMFKIAENDVLRAFVNVPQSSSLAIKKGMQVKITARERPGREFIGKVLGTTNYLDPANRSLLTEIRIENTQEPDGTFSLLPGMYIQANFEVTRENPPLVIPGPAVVTNADGTQVAIVRDGKAHFQKVTLGQDFGSEVEVIGGLRGDEQIITNPSERVVEGVNVSGGNAEVASAQ